MAAVLASLLVWLPGCGRPNPVNIALRKEIQSLQEQVATLRDQNAGQARVIQGLRDRDGGLPTLPSDRLNRLYTVQGLKFGRLTGGADIDPQRPGDEGLKIQVTPLDAGGDPLKAAGSFEVTAFDASRTEKPVVGKWAISREEAVSAWRNVLSQYNYTFTLPWQTPPAGDLLHVEVKFFDELTQTPIKQSIDVKITPPSGSASRPADAR